MSALLFLQRDPTEWRSGSSCLQELLDAFLSDILASLSLARAQPNRGVAEDSRGRHGAERGGVDVDKITSSS